MLNNLRAIYIFVKSVELGSFRATAKALELSPSVVSYQISLLESELKVALLYRSTRKLTLTNEGQMLLEILAPLVDGAERGVDLLTASRSDPIGKLNITMASSFSQEDITRQIAKFARLHPKVELSVNYSDEQKDLIADNIDIAIRSGPINHSSLKAKKLFSIERKLVASPIYLASKPEPNAPEDLVQWDWVWLSVTPDYRILTNRRSKKQSKIKINKRVIVNDGYAMCDFAAEGLGLLASPLYLVESYLKEGKLVEVLPDWQVATIDIYALWPANTPRTGLTHRFVDYLLETLH
jgi:DNA-binding transcriptional LysR family regulator